jgi:hypothetical protein
VLEAGSLARRHLAIPGIGAAVASRRAAELGPHGAVPILCTFAPGTAWARCQARWGGGTTDANGEQRRAAPAQGMAVVRHGLGGEAIEHSGIRRRAPQTAACHTEGPGAGSATAAGQDVQARGTTQMRACGRAQSWRQVRSTGSAQRRSVPTCAAACLLLALPLHVWAAPALLSPRNAPVSGGHTLTITGKDYDNFGAGLSYPKVRVGGTAVPTTTWVSKTSLTAILPPGMLRACQDRCLPKWSADGSGLASALTLL